MFKYIIPKLKRTITMYRFQSNFSTIVYYIFDNNPFKQTIKVFLYSMHYFKPKRDNFTVFVHISYDQNKSPLNLKKVPHILHSFYIDINKLGYICNLRQVFGLIRKLYNIKIRGMRYNKRNFICLHNLQIFIKLTNGFLTITNIAVFNFVLNGSTLSHLILHVLNYFFINIKTNKISPKSFTFEKCSTTTHKHIQHNITRICIALNHFVRYLRSKISVIIVFSFSTFCPRSHNPKAIHIKFYIFPSFRIQFHINKSIKVFSLKP